MLTANEVHNYTPSQKKGKFPIQEFSQIESDTVMRHFHTFGFPAYVLDCELQAGQNWSKHKWKDRAKVSINLGPSPRHGRSISLLLNTQIGIITPQCHVRFGDAFDTSRRGSDVHLPKSLWQEKTYFRNQPGGIIATVLGYADVVTSNQPPQDGEGGLTILSEPLQPKGVPVAPPIPPPVTPPPPTTTTRSGWEVRPLTRFLDNFSNIANYGGTPELVYQEYHPLTIFLASPDPDMLNLEQALRAPDREEFMKSMLKEVRDHEA